MKYKYIKPIVCLAAALIFFSCKKDLGNYNYQELNQVIAEGINPSYIIKLGDPLKITPSLKFSQAQDGTYGYEWFVMNVNAANMLPADQRKELATTKNLDITMQLPPGSYWLYYNVKDNKTGVITTTKVSLKVETSIYEGWMVLNEVNGKGRLDMISKIDNVYSPITDVLGRTGSELVLQGKPMNVTCYGYNFTTYGIYVSTDQSTNRIDPETFKWKKTFNLAYEMVSNVGEGFHADFFSPVKENTGTSYMYSGGNVYYYYYVYNIHYGVPINLVNGEVTPFRPAPFVAAAMDWENFTPIAILFDKDKKRFLRHGNNEPSVSTIPAGQTPLYDASNIGMDLVYMEYTDYNNGEIFAVLKNPAGKLFLARFNPFTGTQSYFSEVLGSDIALAEKFAVSPTYGYLLYTVKGRLYEYDTSLKTSKLMLDKGSEEISLIKFQNIFNQNTPYLKEKVNQLIVASYNPGLSADRNGRLEFFEVPPLNGDLKSTESYTGFGKIVSLDYRER
ncbi:PKD-like family lipoprotein [Pedobacter sp.]|jgi:hypothetical protein|uniref:PKD-like family lipoprotein n=1 Tax=Pedobacter sp. TaxID=1411316 RepID=UPI002B77E7DA|nr:PKD-like family lipoprotein [Pedobacter sp.]HWW41015.1 PKD-like family lipoprotein [Pedobacter sp.]